LGKWRYSSTHFEQPQISVSYLLNNTEFIFKIFCTSVEGHTLCEQ